VPFNLIFFILSFILTPFQLVLSSHHFAKEDLSAGALAKAELMLEYKKQFPYFKINTYPNIILIIKTYKEGMVQIPL
jgi:hypothetical protein